MPYPLRDPADLEKLHARLPAEIPGPPVMAAHILLTGHGQVWADRLPEPRAALFGCGFHHLLRGDPAAFVPGDLERHIRGYVEAPRWFLPLLRAAFPRITPWERIVHIQSGPVLPLDAAAVTRRLRPADGLPDSLRWVADTWGGTDGLLAGGLAWGSFVRGRLVAVACPFLVGHVYEELAVATDPAFRRRGLATACVLRLCADIRRRGRVPSWTASRGNLPSRRLAWACGFRAARTPLGRLIHSGRPGTPLT
ncbi:GNAT family N-acetyltransferase [Nonomuraea sp. NPDC059023]|uniref:GNAT family N-acetyltransferase n=1 Tax=unclassified Nonomuraea TaxID=2593643 RepID=UPI0036AE62E4